MKGLKTLTATLSAAALLASLAPASASAAAYSHYVACGVSENAKPSHVCQKARKKGAFFKSNNATSSTRSASSSRPARTSARRSRKRNPGHALRQQDHLEHPRQAPGDLVRRRQESRHPSSSRSRGTGSRRSSASTRRRRTPPSCACAAARFSTSRCWVSAGRQPAALDASAGGGRGAAAAAGGWGEVGAIAVGVGPGSFAGLRVGIATARGLGAARPAAIRGLHPGCARRGGVAAGAGGEPASPVLDARRGEAFAALYAADGRAPLGAVGRPPGRALRTARGLPEPPLAAGSGAVRFRQELASRGAEVPDSRSHPPGRGPARLRAGGGGAGAASRSTRST